MSNRLGTWNALTLILIVLFAIVVLFEYVRSFRCHLANVYHEARGEPELGQEAVAFVTNARVLAKGLYPKSICAVVLQKRQFSWTITGLDDDAEHFARVRERIDTAVAKASPTTYRIAEKYTRIRYDAAAMEVASRKLSLPLDTHFYKRFDWREDDPNEKKMSDRVKQEWRECREVIRDAQNKPRQIGAHVFYRDKPGPCILSPTPAKNSAGTAPAEPKTAPAPAPPRAEEPGTQSEKKPATKEVPPLRRVVPKE